VGCAFLGESFGYEKLAWFLGFKETHGDIYPSCFFFYSGLAGAGEGRTHNHVMFSRAKYLLGCLYLLFSDLRPFLTFFFTTSSRYHDGESDVNVESKPCSGLTDRMIEGDIA